MLQVLTGFGVVVLVIAVGYLLGRTGVLGKNAQSVLANLVYFVATPALLFDILLDTDPREVLSGNFVVISLSAIIAGVLGFLILRARGRDPADSIIGMLASSYANAGNLGIPLAVYILDDAAVVVPVILFQVALYAPISLTALDVVSSEGETKVVRNIALAFRSPMLLAAIVGMVIAFAGLDLPVFVTEPVGILAGAAVPAALLVFGMSMVGSRVRLSGDVMIAVVLKNIIHPLVAGLLAHFLFGMTGYALFVLVVLGALPTAQNVLTYALRFRTNLTLARDTGVVSTIVSFPVLALVTVLLGG